MLKDYKNKQIKDYDCRDLKSGGCSKGLEKKKSSERPHPLSKSIKGNRGK